MTQGTPASANRCGLPWRFHAEPLKRGKLSERFFLQLQWPTGIYPVLGGSSLLFPAVPKVDFDLQIATLKFQLRTVNC
jgi:hypothetical protein